MASGRCLGFLPPPNLDSIVQNLRQHLDRARTMLLAPALPETEPSTRAVAAAALRLLRATLEADREVLDDLELVANGLAVGDHLFDNFDWVVQQMSSQGDLWEEFCSMHAVHEYRMRDARTGGDRETIEEAEAGVMESLQSWANLMTSRDTVAI